jgi:hypothetical protein
MAVTELVFALEFRGHGGPSGTSTTTRRARTTAPSQILSTVLKAGSIDTAVQQIDGDTAVLDSTVERFPDGSFEEKGTIAYGRFGSVSFTTVGRGTVGQCPIDGWVHGAVIWTITGGEGHLAEARGLITSNFVASAQGEVIDHHVARLYLR